MSGLARSKFAFHACHAGMLPVVAISRSVTALARECAGCTAAANTASAASTTSSDRRRTFTCMTHSFAYNAGCIVVYHVREGESIDDRRSRFEIEEVEVLRQRREFLYVARANGHACRKLRDHHDVVLLGILAQRLHDRGVDVAGDLQHLVRDHRPARELDVHELLG